MIDSLLNSEFIGYITIGVAGTASIIALPIFLAKFITKFREGFHKKNEKTMRDGFYYLFSASVAIFIIIKMFSL